MVYFAHGLSPPSLALGSVPPIRDFGTLFSFRVRNLVLVPRPRSVSLVSLTKGEHDMTFNQFDKEAAARKANEVAEKAQPITDKFREIGKFIIDNRVEIAVVVGTALALQEVDDIGDALAVSAYADVQPLL